MTRKFIVALMGAVGAGALAVALGLVQVPGAGTVAGKLSAPKVATPVTEKSLAPAVSVVKAATAGFVETVLVTGTLVPRDEILVAPEVEGLRVLTLEVEEGDKVAKGQVLARLVHETLDAQLAQNDAALARTGAAIAQARSQIAQAEARLDEAKASFDRAKPLSKSGAMSESVYDQREAAAKTAQAQLTAARDGIKVAEAEKAQVEAQRREILWRRGNTEVKSPAEGVVSRRTARVGAQAAAAGEPMFRIIARGEIELDAEVAEADIGKIAEGVPARVTIPGVEVDGKVRLVSPEIDKVTRMGRVRVFLGTNPALRIGGFARATIETSRSRGMAVPASAVLYGQDGAYVQLVKDGRVATKRVVTGLASGGLVEIKQGVEEGDTVVAKSGTFLRDGDVVRPVLANGQRVSEMN